MDNETNTIRQKVKRELSDFLGIGIEDIENDTEFTTDLHMDAVALTDFLEILEKAGLDTTSIDFTEIDTFLELVEALTAHI